MFKIYDGRSEFYQWDLDRKLIVSDPAIDEVHFCNKTDDCSLVCEVYELDGLRVANVPNILLQSDWDIRVYGYCGNCYTKQSARFKVNARTRPSDYVYTETETKRWEDLEQRVNVTLDGIAAAEEERAKAEAAREAAEAEREEVFDSFAIEIEHAAKQATETAEKAQEALDKSTAAVNNANAATEAANAATNKATIAAANTNAAIESANTAAINANEAATAADTATENTNAAIEAANTATNSANTAAQNAEEAATNANSAIDSANTAAATAISAAEEANAAAQACAVYDVALENHDKRISNIESHIAPEYFYTDDSLAYTKSVPAGACPYAQVNSIVGNTIAEGKDENGLNGTLVNASFKSIESKDAEGNVISTIDFDETVSIPFSTTIDFENQKITNYGVTVVLTGEELYYTYSAVKNDGMIGVYSGQLLPTTERRADAVCTDATIDKLGAFTGDLAIGIGNDRIYWARILTKLGIVEQGKEDLTADEKTVAITAFKAYLAERYAAGNPVTIQYIATTLQSETTFSEDNFIEVVGNGTITAPNADEVPVTSSITYMLKEGNV